MSAFMMSNESLSMLADLISRYHETGGDAFGFYFPKELYDELFEFTNHTWLSNEKIFNALADLNIESLKQRYPHGYESMIGNVEYIPGHDIWRQEILNLEDGVVNIEPWHYQVLKTLDCYLYQCCEGNCDKRKFYKAIERLRDLWGCYIATNQVGYELAEWK